MTDYNNNNQLGAPYADVNGQPGQPVMPPQGGPSYGDGYQVPPPVAPQPQSAPVDQGRMKLCLILGICGLAVSIIASFLAFPLFILFLILELLSLAAGVVAIILYVTTKKKAGVQAPGLPVRSGQLTAGLVCGIIAIVTSIVLSASCACTYVVARQALNVGQKYGQEFWDELEKNGNDYEEFGKHFNEEFAKEFADRFEQEFENSFE